jgi:hypothetical protein
MSKEWSADHLNAFELAVADSCQCGIDSENIRVLSVADVVSNEGPKRWPQLRASRLDGTSAAASASPSGPTSVTIQYEAKYMASILDTDADATSFLEVFASHLDVAIDIGEFSIRMRDKLSADSKSKHELDVSHPTTCSLVPTSRPRTQPLGRYKVADLVPTESPTHSPTNHDDFVDTANHVNHKLTKGAIIAISVCGFFGLLLIILIIVCIVRMCC